MRPTLVLVLLASLTLASIALGGDEKTRVEASAPQAGFSRRIVADTVPATLPRSQPTKTVFATVKVTGEVGEDE